MLFPALALPTVMDEHAVSTIRPRRAAFGGIASSIRRLWMDYPGQEQRDFGIVMATRRREGMDSVFELAISTFEAATATWDLREVEMPRASARLHVAGSGAHEVRNAERLWDATQNAYGRRAFRAELAEPSTVPSPRAWDRVRTHTQAAGRN